MAEVMQLARFMKLHQSNQQTLNMQWRYKGKVGHPRGGRGVASHCIKLVVQYAMVP